MMIISDAEYRECKHNAEQARHQLMFYARRCSQSIRADGLPGEQDETTPFKSCAADSPGAS